MIAKIALTFPNLALANMASTLESTLEGCDSVLDVGCGSNSPLQFTNKQKLRVGVDGYAPAIAGSKKKKIHDRYYKLDVLKIGTKFKKNSFDAVIALDVIEHLKKRNGDKLLKEMEKIAKKKIIILTPNGFIPQSGDHNNLQEHLSGWTIKDFEKRGFDVGGMYGLKSLRGEKASLKLKPKIVGGIISELTQYLLTSQNPKFAFSLFCVKSLQ